MLNRIKDSDFMKIIELMKPRLAKYFISSLVTSVTISICFNISIAFINKNAIDAAIRGDITYVYKALAIGCISFIIGIIIQPISQYTLNKTTEEIVTDIKYKTFNHLAIAKIEEIERYHSGDLLSRTINDIHNLRMFFLTQLVNFISVLIMGIIPIATIFILQWRIGFFVLIVGMTTTYVNRIFAKRTRNITDTVQYEMGKLNENFVDLVKSLSITKIFNIEEKVYNVYNNQNSKVCKSTLKSEHIRSSFLSVNGFLYSLNFLGVIFYGIYLNKKGLVDISTVVAIISLQNNANFFFENINNYILDVQSSLSSGVRILEILNLPVEEEKDTLKSKYKYDKKKVVILDDVRFAYENKDEILKGINIEVEKGQVVAIVGPSGSGKSTIMKLLPKFYTPNSGSILINGVDIDNYSYEDLREHIAYVSQETYLFSGTIEENIGYGKVNATKEEIIEAAKLANAHKFIENLSDGYETIVEEGGKNLSGGQCQRIGIARAILKNAPILLLDEPTSALDAESESLIQDALNVLMKDKTTIVVAHRLSTIRDADIIYVLEDGEVVEKGKHDNLIKDNGLYAKLYNIQFN